VVRADVNADIREFILKMFPRARRLQVKDDDALIEGGMLDSQGVLEVVSFIEKRFAISVADEDLAPEHFQTIERIGAYVEGKTKPAASRQ
jgi:acyl carrier protein